MSLSSAHAAGMSSSGAADTTRALRVPLLLPEGDAPYSVWRPQMETMMMRAGIETRDYKTAIPAWEALVVAVTADEEATDDAAIARVLHGMKVEGASSTPKEPTAGELKARKRVADIVNRSRQAYGLIYSAMAPDLRALIDDVPQGYAFGLWTLLEERFQSSTDDNITDVWTQFVNVTQDQDEAYDAYMARVEKLTVLLEGAGQKPPTGLRKVVLLYRLRPMYEQARLALQLSGKLDVNDKIDWIAVKAFMLDFERNKLRGDDPMMSQEGERAMAARMSAARRKNQSDGNGSSDHSMISGDMANVECYNCHGFGHMSRQCREPRKPRGGYAGGGSGGGRQNQADRGKKSYGSQPGSNASDDEAAESDKAYAMINHVFSVRGIHTRAYETTNEDDRAMVAQKAINSACGGKIAMKSIKVKKTAGVNASGQYPEHTHTQQSVIMSEKSSSAEDAEVESALGRIPTSEARARAVKGTDDASTSGTPETRVKVPSVKREKSATAGRFLFTDVVEYMDECEAQIRAEREMKRKADAVSSGAASSRVKVPSDRVKTNEPTDWLF